MNKTSIFGTILFGFFFYHSLELATKHNDAISELEEQIYRPYQKQIDALEWKIYHIEKEYGSLDQLSREARQTRREVTQKLENGQQLINDLNVQILNLRYHSPNLNEADRVRFIAYHQETLNRLRDEQTEYLQILQNQPEILPVLDKDTEKAREKAAAEVPILKAQIAELKDKAKNFVGSSEYTAIKKKINGHESDRELWGGFLIVSIIALLSICPPLRYLALLALGVATMGKLSKD